MGRRQNLSKTITSKCVGEPYGCASPKMRITKLQNYLAAKLSVQEI